MLLATLRVTASLISAQIRHFQFSVTGRNANLLLTLQSSNVESVLAVVINRNRLKYRSPES